MQPEPDQTSNAQPKHSLVKQDSHEVDQPRVCGADLLDERECPTCGLEMRLWAAFYRCRNCGYKESCCF